MRRAASIAILALLCLPALDCLHLARNAQQLQARLRARHREAPDASWDRYYGQLVVDLPATGRIGLVQIAPPGPPREREHYFLQYALAPRVLVPGTAEDFVIACGPSDAVRSLVDPAAFVPLRRFDDDLTLYRRVRR
jgi:hypothetical protein